MHQARMRATIAIAFYGHMALFLTTPVDVEVVATHIAPTHILSGLCF